LVWQIFPAHDPNRIRNRRKKLNHVVQQGMILKVEQSLVPAQPQAFSAGKHETAQYWKV
jgi:hypothetical protein